MSIPIDAFLKIKTKEEVREELERFFSRNKTRAYEADELPLCFSPHLYAALGILLAEKKVECREKFYAWKEGNHA